MKIAIIGATGKQGSLLLAEALARDFEVTAIVRDKNKLRKPTVKILEKDLFSLKYEDIKENDVIIDAFGAWTENTYPLHQTSLKYLLDMLSGKPNRLLIVGGAGSLYTDNSHTLKVMDAPDFPKEFKPLARNMGAAFDLLKKRQDVNWTYISPSADFRATGPRTGEYKIGKEELMVDSHGASQISYADYAIAMIDEAEKGDHIKERFTVVAK